MNTINKRKQGRLNRVAGQRFESLVRTDLEEKGFICDRWTNNVEINIGKIIPAKPHMVFNPVIKRMVPQQTNSGFPDFVAFKIGSLKTKHSTHPDCFRIFDDLAKYTFYEVIGVEVKSNGILNKLEKEKCRWYLDNKIFSKIWVAEKTKIKNRIVIIYHDFVEKYGK